MENAEVARVLSEIADLLELTGGNAFKVRAYRRAAQVIELHPGPIAGVPVVISTDARDAAHLANLRHGVWVARRGWLEAKDVLNTLPLAELRRRLSRQGATAQRAPGR